MIVIGKLLSMAWNLLLYANNHHAGACLLPITTCMCLEEDNKHLGETSNKLNSQQVKSLICLRYYTRVMSCVGC